MGAYLLLIIVAATIEVIDVDFHKRTAARNAAATAYLSI